jgi:hypothetical protein
MVDAILNEITAVEMVALLSALYDGEELEPLSKDIY